jgi:Phospholipid methyltransferase
MGVLSLGSSFTPLPRPRARTHLRQSGIFRFVRHPVYGGVILIALGWSLAEAPLGLLATALLALLFDLKARREEAWLSERFPEYAAYRARTPRRTCVLALLSPARRENTTPRGQHRHGCHGRPVASPFPQKATLPGPMSAGCSACRG